jgi:hypothetical protein
VNEEAVAHWWVVVPNKKNKLIILDVILCTKIIDIDNSML